MKKKLNLRQQQLKRCLNGKSLSFRISFKPSNPQQHVCKTIRKAFPKQCDDKVVEKKLK